MKIINLSFKKYLEEGVLQKKMEKLLQQKEKNKECMWFLGCHEKAVSTQKHPMLGEVPICAKHKKLVNEETVEEEAPTNATGAAVPGTGDDPAHWVNKKKKNVSDNVVGFLKRNEKRTSELKKDEVK